jgi:hypothetical protein
MLIVFIKNTGIMTLAGIYPQNKKSTMQIMIYKYVKVPTHQDCDSHWLLQFLWS